MLGSAGGLVIANWPSATGHGVRNAMPVKLRTDYRQLAADVAKFEDFQSKNDASLASTSSLQESLSRIQLESAGGRYIQAENGIQALEQQLSAWHTVIAEAGPQQSAATSDTGIDVPIVIYHYPPPDLDDELTYLTDHNYTVVGLGTVAAALNNGASLPPKPVVLTFDDGFANQMQAFDLLKSHNMKATFFIINGGPLSKWCIGAGRRYNDPLQPPGGCGDAYLTWAQVKMLDKSGLITIGGHTLDHPELATLSVSDQEHEIIDSKKQIEAEIGHPIFDFAYPYGNYDDDTINIARQAGYRDAVTTEAGTYQSAGSVYTLKRIRTTIGLP